LENKKVEVGDFVTKECAIQIYKQGIERFNNKTQTNKITNYYKYV
jgi:hypothetical protein